MENLPQNELTLQDIPFMLRRRWLIISALGIIGALGGGLKGLTTGKTFKADVMIQLENRQRSNNASSAEISQLADAFSISNTADAEIEIVKSRLVLGNVVRDRKLNIAVWPKRSLLDRLLRKPTPGLELESFQVGPNLIGHPLELRVLDTAGLYSLRLKDSSSELLRGRIKQTIDSSSNKYKISLLITSVWNAKPGQIFNLVYNDDMAAIQSWKNRSPSRSSAARLAYSL